ncbi:MAG: hypothetical protein DRH03_11085 [Deltaproteobacteria bacterium]|nr:MAG: hypothetical protein DRH03_11085 [Deltaproteobacteria bacterium]
MSELWLENALEANTFLNALFDNLNSAVFIVDQEARVRQVNQVFEKIFAKSEAEVEGQLCGNAIGCIFPLTAGKDCGTLKECKTCLIRGAIVKALTEKISSSGQLISRSFIISGETIDKHLLVAVKYISFNQRDMVVVIVDDITETETRKQIIEERQRLIEKDLEAAAGIQHSLLPRSCPDHNSFIFAWKYEPCISVGGDIFNLIELEDGKVFSYMVDVSGHGVPAALVTVSITQRIQQYILNHQDNFSPLNLLKTLNDEYPMERFDAYFTMTSLLLDSIEKKITYASAGHPAPLLLHRDGSLSLLAEGAAPIGMGGIVPFSEATVPFKPGDTVLCYTDGINEFTNNKDEMYGFDRLHKAAKKLHGSDPDALIEAIYRQVINFSEGREAEDDISMLAIKAR